VLSKWGGDTCVGPAFLAGAPNASVNKDFWEVPKVPWGEVLGPSCVLEFTQNRECAITSDCR
jgi:hypothetical protein